MQNRWKKNDRLVSRDLSRFDGKKEKFKFGSEFSGYSVITYWEWDHYESYPGYRKIWREIYRTDSVWLKKYVKRKLYV